MDCVLWRLVETPIRVLHFVFTSTFALIDVTVSLVTRHVLSRCARLLLALERFHSGRPC